MVTFAQLRHTSFDTLDRAGDTWNAVAGRVEQITAQVRNEVIRPLTGAGPSPLSAPGPAAWTGVAADEASREIGLLATELDVFHYEALAVTATLRRAETAFTTARQSLLRAVGDAEALGATVAEDGSLSLPPLSPEEQNDPDAVAHRRRRWDELQQHAAAIRKAVTAATEADDAAAAALRAVDPAEVDPATRSDVVRAAGRDLSAAAAMPSAPGELAAWWAALDPVVRAGLLSADSSTLVAAGVLGPTGYRWSPPDTGIGSPGSRDPGFDDRMNQATANTLTTVGSLAGHTDAARHMQHYLDATGEPLDVDVDRMLRDDGSFRRAVDAQLAANQAEWRRLALDAFEKSGGAPVAIPVESTNAHRTFDPDGQRNWYLAVGSHAYVTSGVVTARPGPDGKPRVAVEYQVNVWDRYNWDPGKGTPIAGTNVSDADMAALHQTGLAKEYDIRGRSTPTTIPLGDGTGAGPAGTGGPYDDREGGRTDPHRKTR